MKETKNLKFFKITPNFKEWVSGILGQRKYAEVKVAMDLIENEILQEVELNYIINEMGKHSYNEVYRFFAELVKLISHVDENGKPVEFEKEEEEIKS